MTLERYEKLFGLVPFWVPCARGTKVPTNGYKERPYAETLSGPYRSTLVTASASMDGPPNLAVYLGAASGGLCALDLDKDEHLAAWDDENPGLSHTMRSKGQRGAQVWFKIKGKIPSSFQCAFYEWRADGRLSTIHGLHPSGVEYRLLVDAPPAEIEFSDIHWPKDWPVPGDDQAEQAFIAKHGAPWTAGKDGSPVRLSQRHFAARMAESGDIVFDPDTQRFYQYHGKAGLWRQRAEDEIVEAVGALVARDINQAVKLSPADCAEALRKGHGLITHQFSRGAMGQLRGMVAERGRWKKPRGIIHCANGLLDLNDHPFSLKPFDRAYWSRNQVPVAYDPAARCDRYIHELLAPQLSVEDQRLWQLCCGQYLLGRNLFQNFLILTGTAGGGKGTLCKLVVHMIGRSNVHELRTSQLTSRFETSFFHDKSLLYGPDVEPGFLATDGAHVIKALTGGDFMSGEVKGSSTAHELEGDYNVVISCNSRLQARLRGDASAWARRLLILPFESPPVAAPIPHFDTQLFREEGSGILNWMLEGAREVMACARERRPFPITDTQRERVRSLLAESDSVREFIKRRVRRSSFLHDSITSEDFYRAYLTTCDGEGWTGVPQRLFGLKSAEIMVTEYRASKDNHLGPDRISRGWRGVVLVDESDPSSPESY